MRAIDVCEIRIRAALWAWLLGVLAKRVTGMNAVCANPVCAGRGEPLRIDRDGVRRLTPERGTAPAVSTPPPTERPPRDPIPINRTPGMEWTREGRG